ncbi:MAG: C-type lectin domain-containing protein [Gemmataceae bacterium]|nr:C-type lectin domain-containing protein [Gemmataceae bacterium]
MRTALLALAFVAAAAVATTADPAVTLDAIMRGHADKVGKAGEVYDEAVQRSKKAAVAEAVKVARQARGANDRVAENDAWRHVLLPDQTHETARKYFADAGQLDAELEKLPELAAKYPTHRRKAAPPGDAKKFGGHRYKVYDGEWIHRQAAAKAEEYGGHLARIGNADELKFAVGLIRVGKAIDYWIDGCDDIKWNDWRYSDGRKVEFFAWLEGNPERRPGETHLFLQRLGGRMLDGWPNTRCGMVVEWDE